MKKVIGIVGLGLIGGSIAKAVATKTNHTVLAYDKNSDVLAKAINDEVVSRELTEDSLQECSMVVVCLYPQDTIAYVKENIKHMKNGTLIVDCAGVKSSICHELSGFCQDNRCFFVGGHPMAGIERSGYTAASEDLFCGATMILCKDDSTNIVAIAALDLFFKSLGFEKIVHSNAEEHDATIAFTSQLAHVVSNAYVQSTYAEKQSDFSGGSYQDLTRVAYLNEEMWAQLFLENKPFLVPEIRSLAERMMQYADFIENNDKEGLKALLYRGKKMKEKVG